LTLSCMNTSIVYHYSDGNANEYILTTSELKYIPVKPANSSSGMYDGGDPESAAITKNQYKKIQTLFDKALDNPGIQIQNRVMMSAKITMLNSDSKKTCIIKPGSEEIGLIEKNLKKILDTPSQ